MGKAIRLIFGVLFFVGMSYWLIRDELQQTERAQLLMTSGLVANASVDDARITVTRAYLIPIKQDGQLDYHFNTKTGEQINSSKTVLVDSVKALSEDGSHFLPGMPIQVSYLPDNPDINLPVSDLEDQSNFHWLRILFLCTCFGLTGIVGPSRMRRWATDYSQRRMNKTLADLNRPDTTDAELYAAMHRMLEKSQSEEAHATPVNAPAPRKPNSSHVAPRMLPKAGGAARPAFGKRA